MAKKRARKTSTLDSAAIAAGSALGALAKKIDALASQRDAITTKIQRLAGQAQGALTGLAGGRKAKKAVPSRRRRTKAKAKARKTR